MARNTYIKTADGWEQVASTVLAIPQGLVPVVPTSVTNGSFTGDGLASFTAQSTVSLNGVFTGAFDNYFVVVDLSTASASAAVSFRLRSAGTDSSANYIMAMTGISSGGAAAGISSTGTSATFTYLPSGYAGASASFTVINPARALQTKFHGASTGTDSGYTTFTGRSGALYHNTATAYDGLTILTGGAATLTGTIRVYGYSKGGTTQSAQVQPYSMAAGTLTVTGTGAATATATVTFPTGRFTAAPIVTANHNGGSILIPSANSITSTGFTFVFRDRNDATLGSTYQGAWQAIQMTSTSGAG